MAESSPEPVSAPKFLDFSWDFSESPAAAAVLGDANEDDASSIHAVAFVNAKQGSHEVKSDVAAAMQDNALQSQKSKSHDAQNGAPPQNPQKPEAKAKAMGRPGTSGCNCRKSKCLKLYCDCFATGTFCGPSCSCVDCHNVQQFEDRVLKAKETISCKNPAAFKRRIQGSVKAQSCNCEKSGCLKKYCECYKNGVKCGPACNCTNCNNRVALKAVSRRRYGLRKIKAATRGGVQKQQWNNS